MASYKGVGLVRKADGTPRIDGDPNDLHPVIQQKLMTAEERENLGMHLGPLARDAVGIKRLIKVDEHTYEAVDPLVAVNEIYDGVEYYRLSPRLHAKAGEQIRRQ